MQHRPISKMIPWILSMVTTMAMAADPIYRVDLDIQKQANKFQVIIHQADTPLVRAYLYENGTAWKPTASTYGAQLGIGTNYENSTSLATVAGTVNTNGYCDFQFLPADCNTNGSFFCQILVTNSVTARRYTWPDGMIKIQKNPIGGSAASMVWVAMPSGVTHGDMAYYSTNVAAWVRLAPGTAGQILTAGPSGIAPGWSNSAVTDSTSTNWISGDTEAVVAGDPRSGSNVLSIGSAIARDSEVTAATSAVYTAALQTGTNSFLGIGASAVNAALLDGYSAESFSGVPASSDGSVFITTTVNPDQPRIVDLVVAPGYSNGVVAVASNGALAVAATTYLPYTGATGPVNFGVYTQTVARLSGSASPATLADGSIKLNSSHVKLYPGSDGFAGGGVEIYNDDIEQSPKRIFYAEVFSPTPLFDMNLEVKTNLTVGGTITQSGALLSDTYLNMVTGGTVAGPLVCSTNLTVDTDTFVVDALNNRVGVGVAAPVGKFQISGASPDFVLYNSSGSANYKYYYLANNADRLTWSWGNDAWSGWGSVMSMTHDGVAIGSTYSAGAGPTDGLIVQGNVGIGTNTPQAKLHVVGGIIASNITSATAGDALNFPRGDGTWQSINAIHTNSGTVAFSAIATQLVSITGMEGNAWSFKKPMLWTTNTSFSATAKVSLFDSPNLFGCQEVWRNDNVALASVYNTVIVTAGVYQVTVADGTPFGSLVPPFQVAILDSTSNECVTVTNVTGSVLTCAWPTRYGHAVSNVVALAPTLNIPGWINDEAQANTLRMFIEFETAQTVGIGYQFPYMKMR